MRRSALRTLTRPFADRRLPLRMILIVPFVVLLTAAVGATGYLALRTGQEAVETLSERLDAQLHHTVAQALERFLAVPHRLNRLNAETLRRHPDLTRNLDALREQYLDRLRLVDSVVTAAVGLAAGGEFLGVGRRPDGSFDTAVYDRSGSGSYRQYLLDAAGKPTTLLAELRDYDARTRPWYVAAVQAGGPTWSPIYVWASGTTIGLTATLPVHDGTGRLLGVQQAALSLDHLGRFLAELPLARAGEIAILERSGHLVATSLPEGPVQRTPDGRLARRLARESASPTLRGIVDHLTAEHGGLARVPAHYQARVELGGQRWMTRATAFADQGLDWLVVSTVPETELLGPIPAQRRTTILLCVAALLGAIGVGVAAARRVTRPLLGLHAASQALARGDWGQRAPVAWRDEVGEVALAFNRMADHLQELILHLEERVAERTRQLETLRGVSAEIAHELDLSRLLSLITAKTADLLAAGSGSLWLWDEAAQRLAIQVWTGHGDYFRGRSLALGEGIVGQAALRRKSFLIADYARSPYAHPDTLAHARITAALATPLLYRERLLGVLAVDNLGQLERTFSEQDCSLLELFAVQAAIAVENAHLFRRLHQSLEELRAAQDAMLRSEKLRALGQLAAGLAHHLNNQLMVILGQVEILRVSGPDLARADSLASLEAAAAESAALVRRIQEFGRQRHTAALAPVVLAPVAAQALAVTRPRWKEAAERQGARIEAQATLADLPAVLGDPAALREALTNLILNAVDAMPRGGTLTIGGRIPDPGWVEVTVADSGEGMTDEVRRRIFEPFFTTRGVQRSGLGLAVVYGILERHGGSVAVASAPGVGTAVTLRLQAAPASLDPAPPIPGN